MTTATSQAPPDQTFNYSAGRKENTGRRSLLNDPERVAKLLGWFSIGLGLAEIAAPRGVARMIGVADNDRNRNALLAVGLREIAAGVGILSQPRQSGWVWSRVAGDVMDLALLARGLNSPSAERGRVAGATAAVLGVTLFDVLASQSLHRAAGPNGSERLGIAAGRQAGDRAGVQVRKSITTNRPVDEVYRFWRDFSNLPRFMEHLESVEVLSDRRSRWRAKAPAGTTVEWEAEIVDDRPNQLIAWQSAATADVSNRGTVRFEPGPDADSTEIHVELRYDPPGGRLAAMVAKLFGEEPSQQVSGDLRRFKQVMELGEVVHSDASIHPGLHSARPSEEAAALPPIPGGVR
jgi:uncharacterized membrane protein